MHNLADDWSIIIKPADKSLIVVTWDQEAVWLKAIDNLVTTQHILTSKFHQKLLSGLTEKSNGIFRECIIKNLSQKKS